MTGVTGAASVATVNSVIVTDLEHFQLEAPRPPVAGDYALTWSAISDRRLAAAGVFFDTSRSAAALNGGGVIAGGI